MLNVDEINVGYGRAMVLHDVSLKLKEGETVFIVGRNGAGKTTLLRTICGLMKPIQGAIHYRDENIMKSVTRCMAKSGIKAKNPAAMRTMSR